MIRGLVLVAALAAACYAAPYQNFEDLPKEYQDLVPPQAKEFLTGLTDDDKKVLKEIATNYASYKNEDEVLSALKEKSPALHAKAEKVHALLKEKIDALGDEAKAFAKEIIGEARKVQAAVVAGTKPSIEELKTKILSGVEKYKALSDAAKADLEKQFPITASVFKNEKFQEIAKKLLAKQNA